MEFYLIIGLIILLLSGMKKENARSAYDVMKWFPLAKKYGDFYNVDSYLVLSIIATESGGNENAQGPTGDYGLMQITQIALTDFNQAYGTTYKIGDLFIPDTNVHIGTGFFNLIYGRAKAKGLTGTDALYTAIRAYNVGLSKAGSAGFSYQEKVLAWYEIFKKLNYVG